MEAKNKYFQSQGPALARIFSAAVIKEFASKGRSSLALSIIKETGLLNSCDSSTLLRDFFNQIHNVLFHRYRNEYVYKNAIARKILLGVHSLNTSSMLTEFRAGECKADVVVLNGTSTVYEIKSEYDSMNRLARQVASYRQVFDCINIITSESQIDKVNELVGDDIGLIILTDKYTMRTIREPSSLKNWVDPLVIFDSLRKNEYKQIIKAEQGEVPNVSNARMYKACRKLFAYLDPVTAHDAMVAVLRKRSNNKRLREFVLSVPESLTAISLSCKLGVTEQNRFSKLLNTSIRDCLVS